MEGDERGGSEIEMIACLGKVVMMHICKVPQVLTGKFPMLSKCGKTQIQEYTNNLFASINIRQKAGIKSLLTIVFLL